MKNIYDILKAVGIDVPDDKKQALDKDLAANYKTVAEMERKDAAITDLTAQLKTATDGLEAFKGVNVDEMKGQIAKLTKDLSDMDASYKQKIADKDFRYTLEGAITKAKGKNAKAIMALLDVDKLKGSNDVSKDIADALAVVKKENEYLFEAEGKKQSGYSAGAGAGAHDHKGRWEDEDVAAFARAAGLKEKKE